MDGGRVALQGLGRYDAGLVDDLALVKLLASLRRRWPEPGETAELLAPYGEWQVSRALPAARVRARPRSWSEHGSRPARTRSPATTTSRRPRRLDSADGRPAQDRGPRCRAGSVSRSSSGSLVGLARAFRGRRDDPSNGACRRVARALRSGGDALEPRRGRRRGARRHRGQATGHRGPPRRGRDGADPPGADRALTSRPQSRPPGIESGLPDGVPVVRAMPNTPSTVHRGIAGLSAGAHAGDDHLDLAEEALSHLGAVVPGTTAGARRDHRRLGLRDRRTSHCSRRR